MKKMRGHAGRVANKVRGMKKTIMGGKNVGKKIGKGLKKTFQGSENGYLVWEDRVNGGRARLAFSRVTIDAEKEGN